jgi:hypothetical protein
MMSNGTRLPAARRGALAGERGRTGMAEVRLIWAFLLIVAAGVFTTYARTPVGELYQTRLGGIRGGVVATVSYFAFPVGLAAIATLPIVLGRTRRNLLLGWLAAAAILIAFVLWPGSIEEAGIEATPVRAVAAAGGLAALGLSLAGWRSHGRGRMGRERGDRARIVVAAVLGFGALPWIAADFALSLNNVPGLGSIFLTDQLASQPSVPGLHQAVHDGHHHGLDGVLLAWAALLVSRTLGHLAHDGRRRLLTIYTGFLLVYGTANAFQDFWTEQIVKRGLTTHEIPIFLAPSLSVPWLVMTLLTPVAAWVVWLGYRPAAADRSSQRRRRLAGAAAATRS